MKSAEAQRKSNLAHKIVMNPQHNFPIIEITAILSFPFDKIQLYANMILLLNCRNVS